MTGLEYIEEKIKKYPELYFVMRLWFEDAKKIENQKLIEMHDKGFDSVKQLNDDYAIEFAEWVEKLRSSEIDTIDYDLYLRYNTKELLEIFKKERGW